jgi:hypothetical protein
MSIHHMIAWPVLLWDIILWIRHFYDNVEQGLLSQRAHLLGKYPLSCAVPIEPQIGAGLGKVFHNFTRILSHSDVNAQP